VENGGVPCVGGERGHDSDARERRGVAKFIRKSAAGAFKLELVVSREVKYEAHLRRRSFSVSCPLSMSAFARVRCT
jgi:hypothetical protein